MQSIDFHQLNAPIFAVSTISEVEEKLNKDEIFQKDLPTKLKQDITSLIRYWNTKCLKEIPQVLSEKEMNQEFSNQPDSSKVSTLNELTTPSMEESEDDFSTPATPPTFGEDLGKVLNDQVQFESMATDVEHQEAKDDVLENKDEIVQLVKVKSPEKSIKKSFSSFISRIKCAFVKRTKVDSIKTTSIKSKGASTKTSSTKTSSTKTSKTKSMKKKCQELKPLDLTDMKFVESIFDHLQAPLSPKIKQVMERKKFYSIQELEEEIVFWQEEKAANNEFLAKFGYSPWRPLIDARGDFYTEPGHGLDRFDFCPFGPGMPSPQRLRMSKSDFDKDNYFYFGGLESGEDQGHVSKDSFLEEFEARQRNGVFSYMDKYVEAPMSECEDSSNDGSILQINRVQLLDDVASRERRSSGDQLLDDVWKQSEEYQEYLSHEAEDDDDDDEGSFYGMDVKTAAGKRNISSSIWNPPSHTSHTVVETVRNHVAHSKTEVNMKTQDLVPYVKIEASQVKEHRIPRKQVKPLVVDINDGALYKRSVSAYSSLKDYDLAWQKTFHDEQHDIDKVQTTFQSISWALYNILRQNHLEGSFYCDPIFLSPEITYDDDLWEAEPLTEWSDIFMEMAAIFERTDLTSEHAIIAFIYVQRMSRTSGQCLFDGSWQRILMLSLLTAAKVWEDCSIYNSDYSQLFPDVSTKAINQMEVNYLGYLDWNVNVKCSEFASTYFQLREPQDV